MTAPAPDDAWDAEPAGPEPTPWVLGIIVAGTCALFGAFVLVGIYQLIGGVQTFLGIASVLVVGGGLGWTLWEFRSRPVWRWIVWGLLIGFLGGIASSIALAALGR